MKLITTLIVLIVCTQTSAQETISTKRDIDDEVQRIDQDSRLKSVTFSIQAMKKVLHYIDYNYLADENGYSKINRQFARNNDTTRQTFYLKKGELIFATEQIVPYYPERNKTDSIAWRGDFYFSKGKLFDHVTLGHGKSELDTWNPEQEMLIAFIESKNDIGRHKE